MTSDAVSRNKFIFVLVRFDVLFKYTDDFAAKFRGVCAMKRWKFGFRIALWRVFAF